MIIGLRVTTCCGAQGSERKKERHTCRQLARANRGRLNQPAKATRSSSLSRPSPSSQAGRLVDLLWKSRYILTNNNHQTTQTAIQRVVVTNRYFVCALFLSHPLADDNGIVESFTNCSVELYGVQAYFDHKYTKVNVCQLLKFTLRFVERWHCVLVDLVF